MRQDYYTLVRQTDRLTVHTSGLKKALAKIESCKYFTQVVVIGEGWDLGGHRVKNWLSSQVSAPQCPVNAPSVPRQWSNSARSPSPVKFVTVLPRLNTGICIATISMIRYLYDTLPLWYAISMIRYLYDTLSLWYAIAMIRYRYDTLSLWYATAMIRYLYDTLSLWYAISMIRYLYDTLSLWYAISMIRYLYDTLSLWYAISMIRYLYDTLSLWYAISMIRYRYDTLSLWYAIAIGRVWSARVRSLEILRHGQGTEPVPQGEQTVRFIHSPTERSWLSHDTVRSH